MRLPLRALASSLSARATRETVYSGMPPLMTVASWMKRGSKLRDFIFQARSWGSFGMQCPPMPGPGQKGMKPKGLVAAARTTSQTSRPSRSHIWAISLTRAMLTARKEFSRSLTSSAALALETGTTWRTIEA